MEMLEKGRKALNESYSADGRGGAGITDSLTMVVFLLALKLSTWMSKVSYMYEVLFCIL